MNENTFANGKRLFERIVHVNDSCSIPFETLIVAMHFLYGQKVIINFNIQ